MDGMRVLLDQNVDDNVQHAFIDRGHTVQKVRDLLGADAVDRVIAVTACDQGLIVVTHDRDYRKFQQLIAIGARNEFALGSGRISHSVPEPKALETLTRHMEEIEYFYQRAIISGQRLLIRVTEQYLSRFNDLDHLHLRE